MKDCKHPIDMLVSTSEHFVTYLHRDHYFDNRFFQAGNEPGFNNPVAYHYANRPDLSAKRIRQIVFEDFSLGINGVSI